MSPGVTLPVSDGGARSKRYGEGDWKAKAPCGDGELQGSVHKGSPLEREDMGPEGQPCSLGEGDPCLHFSTSFFPVVIIMKG